MLMSTEFKKSQFLWVIPQKLIALVNGIAHFTEDTHLI